MPDYRRWYVEGGTYFFTLVTFDRRIIFDKPDFVAMLREAVAVERATHPFDIRAAVILPEHLHLLVTLPPGDTDYSRRIGRIKTGFTRRLRQAGFAIGPGREDGYASVWQPRFWEHTIRDTRDMERHVDYIHYNPVRHGYCQCPHAWEASSFRYWVESGWLPANWCCYCHETGATAVPDFSDIAASVGE